MDKLFNLQKNMMEYYKGDAKRIQHLRKFTHLQNLSVWVKILMSIHSLFWSLPL